MPRNYYVYILTNHSGTLYIGITSNLQRRLWEHRQKVADGFTKKYNINKLIYFEEYQDSLTAIEREKQLKRWNRSKKEWLISMKNPRFEEISVE